MKLIVGLGNLGKKYASTRHNVGFMVVDACATRISNFQLPTSNNHRWESSKKAEALLCKFNFKGEKIELLKPQTSMNKSGISVAYARNKHKIPLNNIFIIHDDLDIKLGEYKITKGKGPREHKGLKSIYEKLGTKDFWHVRVGIENRRKMEDGKWKMENRVSGEDYVLQNFTKDELNIIDTVIKKVANEVISRLTDK
jgi:PTH1 family peptidyl-tRNA hydrolase